MCVGERGGGGEERDIMIQFKIGKVGGKGMKGVVMVS